MGNNIIEIIYKLINKFLNFFGPIFALVINSFLIYTYFSVLKNVFPYWYIYYYSYESKKVFYFIYKLLISLELFYSLFNNILAIIIKPGNISDIRKSKYYKVHSPYYSESLLFPISTNDINKNNSIDIEKGLQNKSNIKKNNWEICTICKEIKPLRTHHCSICGSCVIKMDHHCPWINNCIGINNHRYFLLFLLHVFLYTIINTFFILPIFIINKELNSKRINTMKEGPNIMEIKYLGIMGLTCVVIEIFFSGWNWFLAINGNTTIEFWSKKTGIELFNGINDYSFGSWKKNLFYIFGANNLFTIIFIPSIKKLPFSGIEISKFIDPDFSIIGIN